MPEVMSYLFICVSVHFTWLPLWENLCFIGMSSDLFSNLLTLHARSYVITFHMCFSSFYLIANVGESVFYWHEFKFVFQSVDLACLKLCHIYSYVFQFILLNCIVGESLFYWHEFRFVFQSVDLTCLKLCHICSYVF